MLRTVGTVEKNVIATPAGVIDLVAATSTEVLPSLVGNVNEFAGRYIQNVGGAELFYAFGQDCDNVASYHGKMSVNQQLDCSNHGSAVKVFSAGAGGKVAVTILRRDDLVRVPSFAL